MIVELTLVHWLNGCTASFTSQHWGQGAAPAEHQGRQQFTSLHRGVTQWYVVCSVHHIVKMNKSQQLLMPSCGTVALSTNHPTLHI
jgi:hypothetical protein